MMTKKLFLIALLLLACAGLISCSHHRTDAAISADVQSRIHQNAALAATPIAVQSERGVVVLSGSVATDIARITAENDARQVDGVKGVVNNLQVVTGVATPQPSPANPEPQSAKPRPGTVRPSKAATASTPRPPGSLTAAEVSPSLAQPPSPSLERSVPARAVPAEVTLPEGTRLTVRLIDPVDTAKNKEGDTFRASLDAPVVVQDKTVIPKNADVTARLASAKSAGRFTGSSSVVLILDTITVGGKKYALQTGEFTRQGASRGSRTAKVIGGTAAVGAVIGAIAGGGKGAAIGAAAGAGAGTGVQALTKGQQVKLASETLLEFELAAPLTVTPNAEEAEKDVAG